MAKFTDFGESAADDLFGHFEVIGRLQVDPVPRRLAKRLAEKQSHLSGYGPLIGYFDIVQLAVFKPETDAPLIVDPNAPLSGAISAQGFQAVLGRHAEIVKYHGRVQTGTEQIALGLLEGHL